jgi:hypothetical protein
LRGTVFVLRPHARAGERKDRVGKTVGGSCFHIPSYLAMDKGFYRAEGLDAQFIVLQARALVTAGLSGNVDLVPIPSGGAQAALSGAAITYVVGESLKSQWTIVVPKSIDKIESLHGKTLGYGRPGSADYDEGALVLQRFFHMQVGRDYKVISFQGEADRVGALINGDIQGALISVPHAARASAAGMKVLLRTGDYIARAGAAVWALTDRQLQIPRRPRNSFARLRRLSCISARTRRARWRRSRIISGSIISRRQASSGTSCTMPSAPSCRKISFARSWNPVAKP